MSTERKWKNVVLPLRYSLLLSAWRKVVGTPRLAAPIPETKTPPHEITNSLSNTPLAQ